MYRSLAEIVEAEKMSGKSFWQVVLEDDIKEQGITFNEGFAQMKDMYLTINYVRQVEWWEPMVADLSRQGLREEVYAVIL